MSYRARAADFGGFLDYNTGKVGYLRGTRGQICTNGLVKAALANPSYEKYWPTIKAYGYQWVGMVTGDCAGYYEMFLSGGSYQRPLTQWKYPDITANSLYALAKQYGLPHGRMDTLPRDCPYPIAVGYSGHVGFYYHGKVYQSASHKMGTIITDLNSTQHNKAWQYWYVIPWLDYEGWMPGSDQSGEEVQEMINILGKGPEVAAVQQALIDLGFAGEMNPTYIGTGGPKTIAALISFQKSAGIAQTGVVDEATQAALIRGLVASTNHEADGLKKTVGDLLLANSNLKKKIDAAQAALS